MEEPKHKCACANCGAVIEYTGADVGSAAQCPNCGESSQLPNPNPFASNPVEPTAFEPGEEPEAAKRPRFCGECRAPIPEGQVDCPDCKLRRLKRKSLIAIAILAAIAAIAGGAWYFKHHKPADDTVTLPDPSGPLPRPNIAQLNSTNELSVTSLDLQQLRQLSKDTVLIAVGDVANNTGTNHSDLRLDLDLLDATGKKIDSLSVFMNNLVPHGNWHFSEPVTNPLVKRIRVASLTEKK